MRKRIKVALLALLTLLIGTSLVIAQEVDAEEEAAWDDAGFDEGYIYSGMTGSLWMPELTDLNAALADAEYASLNRGMWMGGQASIMGSKEGVRVGFSTLSGSTMCRGETDRRAQLASSLYLLLIEKLVAEEAEGDVTLGVALGGASSTLTLVDHTPTSFEDALTVPFRAELTHWSYIVEPALVAAHSPMPGFDIRLRIGLLFALGSRWKAGEGSFRVPMDAFSGPRVALSLQIDINELLGELDLPVGIDDVEVAP